MKFFNNCKTIDEVKHLYRNLCKEHHPDKGGNLETMQAINVEYSIACKIVLKGDTVHNYTDEEIDEQILNLEKYKEAINAIINIDGIIIELVGCWIWVTGNTYPHRITLKNAKYFFAHKKAAWYFRTEEYKVQNRRKMTLEQIKYKYGSKQLKREEDKYKISA